MKAVIFKLEDGLHKRFKVACAGNLMKMSEVLRDLVRGYVEYEPRAEKGFEGWDKKADEMGEVLGKPFVHKEALEGSRFGAAAEEVSKESTPPRHSSRAPKVQPGCSGARAHDTGECKCWENFNG